MHTALSTVRTRLFAVLAATVLTLLLGGGPALASAATPAAPATIQAPAAIPPASPIGVWDVTATAENVPPHQVKLTFVADGTLTGETNGSVGKGTWRADPLQSNKFTFVLNQPSGDSGSVRIEHSGSVDQTTLTSSGTSTLLDADGNVISTTKSSASGKRIS